VDLAQRVDRRETPRRRTRRFVLNERRLGFERRHRHGAAAALDAPLAFLRDHPAALLAVLALANLLSLLDLRLTLVALRNGAAEANPFMQYVFGAGAAQAAATKIGVVVVASVGIWALRRYRQALLLAPLAVAVYGTVVVYELVSLR
jgi:hypothetical protein